MGFDMWISMTPGSRRALGRSLAVTGLAALCGCMPDANPVRDAAVAAGFGAKITPAPEFVAQTRPAKLDYIPVGTAVSGRPTAARTAAEVKAAEAELDAVRAANEAAAKAAQQAGGTPAPGPVPVKPKPGAAKTP
jgi:hypothetical protein